MARADTVPRPKKERKGPCRRPASRLWLSRTSAPERTSFFPFLRRREECYRSSFHYKAYSVEISWLLPALQLKSHRFCEFSFPVTVPHRVECRAPGRSRSQITLYTCAGDERPSSFLIADRNLRSLPTPARTPVPAPARRGWQEVPVGRRPRLRCFRLAPEQRG